MSARGPEGNHGGRTSFTDVALAASAVAAISVASGVVMQPAMRGSVSRSGQESVYPAPERTMPVLDNRASNTSRPNPVQVQLGVISDRANSALAFDGKHKQVKGFGGSKVSEGGDYRRNGMVRGSEREEKGVVKDEKLTGDSTSLDSAHALNLRERVNSRVGKPEHLRHLSPKQLSMLVEKAVSDALKSVPREERLQDDSVKEFVKSYLGTCAFYLVADDVLKTKIEALLVKSLYRDRVINKDRIVNPNSKREREREHYLAWNSAGVDGDVYDQLFFSKGLFYKDEFFKAAKDAGIFDLIDADLNLRREITNSAKYVFAQRDKSRSIERRGGVERKVVEDLDIDSFGEPMTYADAEREAMEAKIAAIDTEIEVWKDVIDAEAKERRIDDMVYAGWAVGVSKLVEFQSGKSKEGKEVARSGGSESDGVETEEFGPLFEKHFAQTGVTPEAEEKGMISDAVISEKMAQPAEA